MPSTIPEEAAIRQLLLFSDAVFQYAPAEDSVKTATASAFNNDYTHYPPAPLADKLETFQKFFKDLTAHRAEYYAGGLSHLSSGLVTDVDESSVWRLINQLAEATASQLQAETLMHARLLLKLAEIQHREENEINAALSAVDSQMDQIFSELQNEEGKQIDEVLPVETHPKNNNQLQLLKAWFHLFGADQTTNTYAVIATDYETYNTLNEYASTLISPQQNILCRLVIPARCLSAPQEEFNELRCQFLQTRKSEINKLQGAITAAANGSRFDEQEAATFNSALENSLGERTDTHGPAVTLYTMPLSLPQLAAKVLKKPIDTAAHNYPPNTIVAVSC
jgi:hypothetical protein